MNAGRTWTLVGMKDGGQIGSVLIHPANPDIVFAAASGSLWAEGGERGLYRTTDGGKTWKNMGYRL